ncbi:MAG: Gfo/Idh/MocA family oxidoreductase [Candidatus Omnitrophica bacterium]|nr:Gfo/Idh/MocA family oxidoreductase [Candidatus Omnitrophota bacterium]
MTESMKKEMLLSRRHFVAGAGAAAVTLSVLKPETVFGATANSKLEIGMIGCGGRGRWIADLFQKHGGYQVVAAADYFQDRVDAFGEKFGVPADRRYTGLACYKRLLEGKLDAVVIESPPCFHPEQAAAAVAAGRHVFLAKPIAVDVPGCHSIEESGRKASENKLCFLVDFQSRATAFYQEAVQRVHNGDIGLIVSGDVEYHTGRLGIQAPPGDQEARLKNWVFDIALSGDIITEQNIHALDVCTWILDQAPLKAIGRGGRKGRTDVGDCWDHFSVIYTFPNDVLMTFSSKQFGEGHDDILCRVYGVDGTIHTHYGGEVSIKGKKPYEGGQTPDIYEKGAVTNIATFHDSIQKGDFGNPTVSPSVRSNLTTIVGRTAAYTGKEVTWDEVVKSTERLDPKLQGLKD